MSFRVYRLACVEGEMMLDPASCHADADAGHRGLSRKAVREILLLEKLLKVPKCVLLPIQSKMPKIDT